MTEPTFRVVSDLSVDGRWFLEEPRDERGKTIDPRQFSNGTKVDVDGSLCVQIRTNGQPVGLTFADFDMLVADRSTSLLLARHSNAEIQLIPVRIDSAPGEYSIVNVLTKYDCIDESRSQFMRWAERDGIPGKAGQYRSFAKLSLDAKRIGPSSLFRITNWEQVLVVTRRLKLLLEEYLVTGISFLPLDQ